MSLNFESQDETTHIIELTDNEPAEVVAPLPGRSFYQPMLVICASLVAIVVAGSMWGILSLNPRAQGNLPVVKTIVTSGTQEAEMRVMPTPTTKVTTKANGVATSTLAQSTTSTAASTSAVPIVGGSAMLYGTNLTLNDSSDQVLVSASTRALLLKLHPGIIRFPMRTGSPESLMVQALQAIKSIGAAPMVILSTTVNNPNALVDDSLLIKDANTIFGGVPIYYEYGNEPDLGVGDPTPYIASWN